MPTLALFLALVGAADSAPGAWWSLETIARPPTPRTRAVSTSPIDAFVDARLEAEGLARAPEASRRVLIRRLCFDLVGLPPSPAEVEEFVDDEEPEAYSRLVDRLLASPRHGERWTQHWLDIAHYADTHGFERDQRRPDAWRYRDWVIDALNDDRPYDEFLRLQIAGDALRPDDPDATIATGFLAAGPWDFVGQAETPSPVLKRAARADDLDDMVTQVMTATCALSVNCARCHDHKLDPIPQRDYYRLWAVFAGARRGVREINPRTPETLENERARIDAEIEPLLARLRALRGDEIDLADIVGGGDGTGSGERGLGVDPLSGKTIEKRRGFLDEVPFDRFTASSLERVDGVVIPRTGGTLTISTTGLTLDDVPATSGQAWDAIRNGPVNSQDSSALDGVEYRDPPHSLIGIHANAAITFDLARIRASSGDGALEFSTRVGYGGANRETRADFAIHVDGVRVAHHRGLRFDAPGVAITTTISASARFLTLLATDGGDGIGHDQVFFADARLRSLDRAPPTAEALDEIATLEARVETLRRERQALAASARVYAVVPGPADPVNVLERGDPESPAERVTPGALACVDSLDPDLGAEDTPGPERRAALARWITDPRHPLTSRVIVNRLWHHHFGRGLVATPSDFGRTGEPPSHPSLLDWLATECLESGWSQKRLHRTIVTSASYRQDSRQNQGPGARIDSENRLLWRQNPRRLDAETLRDTLLSLGARLRLEMGGPGFEDFRYTEAYAPIYEHIAPDRPALWRRSVYRFVVRTTPHPLLASFDCPDPANLTPVRARTTTALQSLALLHDDLVLTTAERFAARLEAELGPDALEASIVRACRLAFSRTPEPGERARMIAFAQRHGLAALCRVLLNANELVHVD